MGMIASKLKWKSVNEDVQGTLGTRGSLIFYGRKVGAILNG